jgi:MoaA/NifB/PqqE/SkfB family radical SAM enzyme
MARTARYIQEKYETIESIRGFLNGDGFPKYPTNLFLEVSNLCDLKCAMCGPFSAMNPTRMFSLKEDRGFMATPEGMSLDDLFAHALRIQVFGYGEPTLNPDFPDFLKLAGHYETLINFFTNGMHLTPQLVEQIVDAQVSEVSISFSGATPSHYENIYLGGVWDTVMAGIRRLSARKAETGSAFPVISINSIAYEHHVAQFDTFIEIMGDAGVNVVYLKPLVPVSSVPQLAHHASIYRPWVEGPILERAKEIGRGNKVWLNTHLYESAGAVDEADYKRKKDEMFRMYNLDPDNLPEATPVEQFKPLARTIPMLKPPKDYAVGDSGILGYRDVLPAKELGAEGLYCLEPFHTFYVRRDLEVKPCCNALAPTNLGNVSKGAAIDVWNGQGFDETRRNILDGKYPRMCHGCVKNGNAHATHHFYEALDEYDRWYRNVFGAAFQVDLPSFEALGQSPQVAERWKSVEAAKAHDVAPYVWKEPWLDRALRRVAQLVK